VVDQPHAVGAAPELVPVGDEPGHVHPRHDRPAAPSADPPGRVGVDGQVDELDRDRVSLAGPDPGAGVVEGDAALAVALHDLLQLGAADREVMAGERGKQDVDQMFSSMSDQYRAPGG
jgi:hypothetical protein